MGLFNKIKTAIGISSEYQSVDSDEFTNVLKQSITEYLKDSRYFYTVTFSNVPVYNDVIKKWDNDKKCEFAIFLAETVKKKHMPYKRGEKDGVNEYQMASQMLQNMFRSKMKFSEENIIILFDIFKSYNPEKKYLGLYWWPLVGFFKQIESSFSPNEIPNAIVNILNEILEVKGDSNSYNFKEQIKLQEKIKTYLHSGTSNDGGIKPTYFVGEDGFQKYANELIDNQKEEDKKLWFTLVSLAQKANGSKPSQKYLNEAKKGIDQLGSDKFKKVTQDWFTFIIEMKESITSQTQVYDNREYVYNTIEFLDALNSDAIKGFVWMNSWFYDGNTIQTISKLCERCFKKIPEKGPAAAGIGNACLYTLYASKGLDGIAQLSRLRLKIKQNNTLTLIEKYIQEAAQKLGVSSIEIEDLAVDDFKLKEYQLNYAFDDYRATLFLTGIGKSLIKWYKPDGSEQKTVPQLVKDKYATKLKKLKAIQKQIDQTTSSQKERFDRMLRSNRMMSLEYLKEKYIKHELLSFII
ncbi:MAG: hypothetical protein KYX68_13460, partial [Flavobacterium sp.]|nr:hypothetical protein [Flavobacterium sp.]